jgi:urease accessory protein UreF
MNLSAFFKALFQHIAFPGRCLTILENINRLMEKRMENEQQLVDAINTGTEKLIKIGTETQQLLQRIAELAEQLKNQPVSPAVQAAVAAMLAQADTVDALVADPQPTPEVPAE